MISIRKTANELDRLEDFSRAAVTCYSQAIGATEHHATELPSGQVAQFRAQLEALRQQLKGAAGPEDLKGVQATFETEVKGYQDRVREYLDQLRREVLSAAAAVETFTSSFTQSGSDLETGVKRELQHLNTVASKSDIEEIRGGIRAATARITTDVEQMRAGNQLAIAQLKDEIRVLHQEIQGMRRSSQPLAEENNPAREDLSGRVQELARRGRPFSVLLAVVRNVAGLQNCHPPKVLESGFNTFKARFENTLPGSVTVGCWTRGQFAAVLDLDPPLAISLSREVLRKLRSPIVEEADGKQHTLAFDVTTGVIDFQPGADPQKFQTRLNQLVAALVGN